MIGRQRSKEVSDRLKSPACAHWKTWEAKLKAVAKLKSFQSLCNRHPKAKEGVKKQTNLCRPEVISWHCGSEINKIQIVGNFNRAGQKISGGIYRFKKSYKAYQFTMIHGLYLDLK